jgi:hypothetical protein
MMTEHEILSEQKEIRQRIKELSIELDRLHDRINYGFQEVCPHPETYRYDNWGQYVPSETICGLCNKVLE